MQDRRTRSFTDCRRDTALTVFPPLTLMTMLSQAACEEEAEAAACTTNTASLRSVITMRFPGQHLGRKNNRYTLILTLIPCERITDTYRHRLTRERSGKQLLASGSVMQSETKRQEKRDTGDDGEHDMKKWKTRVSSSRSPFSPAPFMSAVLVCSFLIRLCECTCVCVCTCLWETGADPEIRSLPEEERWLWWTFNPVKFSRRGRRQKGGHVF